MMINSVSPCIAFVGRRTYWLKNVDVV